MSILVSEDQLKEWTGYNQRPKLEAWLLNNKIKFTFGQGNKIITTAAAIDLALVGTMGKEKDEDGFF